MLRTPAAALVVTIALLAATVGCGSDPAGTGGSGGSGGSGGPQGGSGGGGGEEFTLQPFIHVNYLDISKVESISRFRSAVGHDFADSYETCRSMKHYFLPSVADWTTMEIRSPVDGTITHVEDRMTFGSQVFIQPHEQPALVLRLFHVQLADGVEAMAHVTAGQVLGTHVSNETLSDVAIELDGADGYRLFSYALALADDAFAELEQRGVASREALVISEAARDADPLGCAADGSFTDGGMLEDWVDLE